MGIVHKVKRAAAAAAAESKIAATAASTGSSSLSPVSKYPRFGKRGAPQAFPSKLYQILEEENAEVIGWTATGRGFEVRDHARLSSEVLGRFFKQDKFSSFQRQLNLYGFRKITKGSEAGSYQHPHFRRGERTTLLTIRRSTKASTARVVPNSPASGSSAPAVPVTSAVQVSSAAGDKARSATPSPPPAPVRGILPWPRPPTAMPALHSEARGVSPDTDSVRGSTGGMSFPNRGADSSSSDRHSGEHRQQKQQHSVRTGDAGSWGAEGGGGRYAEPVGHASAQGGWKKTAAGEAGGSGSSANGVYAEQGSQYGEEATKREREKAQGLDHQDVEVVGLLQRMAKTQDSPSRQQAAAAAARWEGGQGQGQASLTDTTQPHFRMPRPVGAPEEAAPGQQMVLAERLYDILNHERVNNVPREPFPFVFTADGRVSGIAQHPHARLPAPFSPAPSSSASDSHGSPRCGNGEISESDRRALLAHAHPAPTDAREGPYHGHRHRVGGPVFESGAQGPAVASSFGYAFDGTVGVDNGRRGGAEREGFHRGPWQGSEAPYAAPSMSSTFSKYQGEENGNMRGVMGASVRPGEAWTQHRQYEGGR